MRKVTYYLATILLLSFVFGSCQQGNEEPILNYEERLSVQSFNTIQDLSPQEQRIVFKALARFTFEQTSDGFYRTKQKSGSEINVSENIYAYIQEVIGKTNRRIIAVRQHSTRFGVWDNDTSATGGDFQTNNDCMIFAIETLLHDMGKTNITAEEIRRDLKRLGYYDEEKGTYGSCVESALHSYFNVTPIYDIDNFTYDQSSGGNYCAIGRYPRGNNQYDYHAGVVSWSYNGTMIYRDTQWNDTTESYEPSSGIFLQGNVLMLYKLTLK